MMNNANQFQTLLTALEAAELYLFDDPATAAELLRTAQTVAAELAQQALATGQP